ncbi:MAG: restriction endonuclease [Acinetobacter sp.]
MKNPFIELDHEDWECFAEDVLSHLEYKIISGPSLGADHGKDLIVQKGGIRYLVSCKHHKKAINPDIEKDIRDRIEDHDCNGFIAFYSSKITSGLQTKFSALKQKGFDIVELYKTQILDIIPSMMGIVLSKYFKEPHELYHHVNQNMTYKSLPCLKCDCKDIFSKERLPLSMVTLYKKGNELHFEFGCKDCIGKYPEHNFVGEATEDFYFYIMEFDFVEIYWMEISQIRFFEEFFGMRDLIDVFIENELLVPSSDFYKNFSKFHTALMQVMVPQAWGVWLPKEYKENMMILSIFH